MQPQLASIITQLDAASERVRALAARTTADRWTRRADPNRWSVGECVVHLSLTTSAYLPLIRAALDDPRTPPQAATPDTRYRRDPVGWLLGYLVGPWPRVMRTRARIKTPAAFVGRGDTPRDDTIAEFADLQAQLVALVRESNGRAIDRVRIPSPFDQRAKYNVYSALVLLPRHQQRHLTQAEEVWGAA